MLDSLLADIRQGIKSTLRSPVWSATVLITLGIAIGAGAAVFGVLNSVVLRRIPSPNPDGLVSISAYDKLICESQDCIRQLRSAPSTLV
jgi:hypothetical protein